MRTLWLVCVLLLLVGTAWGEQTAGYVEMAYSSVMFYKQTDGSLRVLGRVANLGNVPVCFVYVTLFYYDKNDRLLGDSSVYVLGETATTKDGRQSTSGISVGRMAAFVMSVSDVSYDAVSTYRVLISWEEADVITAIGVTTWGTIKRDVTLLLPTGIAQKQVKYLNNF